MEQQAKQRLRSPNYPAFSLKDALGRAEALYRKDGKASVHTTAAIKAWGYSSLNGRSLGTLAALRQYGLLEDVQRQMVKLSQLALTIILGEPGSAQRNQAISEAAHTPPIFAELFAQYAEGFPSDETMVRNLTLSTNYSEAAAQKLIASFKETIDLVESNKPVNTSQVKDKKPESSGWPDYFPTILDRMTPTPPGNNPKPKGGAMPEVQSPAATPPYDLTLALLGGEHAVLRVPRHMSKANYDLLTSLIDANLKAMRAALVSEPTITPTDVDAGRSNA